VAGKLTTNLLQIPDLAESNCEKFFKISGAEEMTFDPTH